MRGGGKENEPHPELLATLNSRPIVHGHCVPSRAHDKSIEMSPPEGVTEASVTPEWLGEARE